MPGVRHNVAVYLETADPPDGGLPDLVSSGRGPPSIGLARPGSMRLDLGEPAKHPFRAMQSPATSIGSPASQVGTVQVGGTRGAFGRIRGPIAAISGVLLLEGLLLQGLVLQGLGVLVRRGAVAG